MKPDGSAYGALNRLSDLVIVNLLFVVCSIPVVTAGASYAALHKVLQNFSFGIETSSVIRTYFQAWRDNWKQATVIEAAAAVMSVGIFCYALLVQRLFHGPVRWLMRIVTVLAAGYLSGILGVLFSFAVRYQNTLREHLHNALCFTVQNPIRTAVTAVCAAAPAILFLYRFDVFVRTGFVWLFFGVSGLSWLINKTMYPVFRKNEGTEKAV